MQSTNLTQRRRPHSSTRHAVATVEFALVLPAVLIVFVGIVDFGRIFRHDLRLTHAARIGALIASDSHLADRSGWNSPEEAALQSCKGWNPPPLITVTYGTDISGSEFAEVTASAKFKSLTKVVGIGKEFQVTRTVRMQRRKQEEAE